MKPALYGPAIANTITDTYGKLACLLSERKNEFLLTRRSLLRITTDDP